jgi:DNA-binding response OmpR family regulator
VTESASPPVVVVADDEADILELVAIGLERTGYVVHRAGDGEQALALMYEHKPDVAILDVAMPKLNGFELTRRLRNDPSTSQIKIVLLTARVQDADVEEGFAAGAHEYVMKPFSPQELGARVAALLQRP